MLWPRKSAPRPPTAAIEADADARTETLLEHEGAILDDLEGCLGDVHRTEVDDLRAAAQEALEAYRNETYFPAQAGATVVLTTAIHVQLGIPSFGKARETFEKTAMESSIQQFRLRAILRVVYHAIAKFHGTPGECLPDKFNRHASTHRISRVQFNRTNALAGLMLVVPLVRELDYWFADQAAKRNADAA